jgi:hypothetical protein
VNWGEKGDGAGLGGVLGGIRQKRNHILGFGNGSFN